MNRGRKRSVFLLITGAMVGILVVSSVALVRDPLSAYQWLFEKTDGRFTWLGGLPVLLLRTTGRKTAQERTAALVYLKDGDELVVVASRGGSDKPPRWLLNIQDHPEVGVQIGRQRSRMRARVADSQERARLWPLVNQNNSNRYDAYQAKTKRQIPLVILSPF
ncbi:MAG: nitroreductase family deazaflavin-dependent oxidoreductase [Deltaproteobacteria bacterium]|nr:nitroreductase family deazaflavin-dependent oxidoreductase [Deltaproteobacteria bacterium]MBI3389532.1 nitroreductase family deazaflavin-dependent oxidoreductase [Deltaproteobacteria bacterium]